MNKNPKSYIRFAGKIILIIGIITFVTGLLLLLISMSSFAFWLTALSVLLNVSGITLITSKKS